LLIALLAMAATCAWFSAISIRRAFSGEVIYGLVTLPLWVSVGIGLWRLLPWARALALCILWVLLVGVGGPFGMLSVFEAINGDAPPGPVWQQFLYQVAPVAAPSAFFIEMLCAYRREFRKVGLEDDASIASLQPEPPRSWPLWVLSTMVVPALLLLALNLAIARAGGCISYPLWGNTPQRSIWVVWGIVSYGCLGMGLIAFIRAAPVEARKIAVLIRALIYATGGLFFLSEIASWAQYTNMCDG
jgi:hypothetical protein